MNATQLKENVLRAEGYAKGFVDGYAACAKMVAEEFAKEETRNGSGDKTPPPTN